VEVAACLLNRAKTHCSQLGDRIKEKEKVKSTLRSNGYLNNVLVKCYRTLTESSEGEEGIQRFGGDTLCGRPVWSYPKGWWHSGNQDSSFLGRHFKEKIDSCETKGEEKDLIYKILFECGAKYIGETGRSLDIRVSEHRRNWLKLDRERERRRGMKQPHHLLLASHAGVHNHQVNWEEVTVLAKESNTSKRKIHEAWIQHEFSMNSAMHRR
jgi:hypothetical protein